jgi:hypothetical protein
MSATGSAAPEGYEESYVQSLDHFCHMLVEDFLMRKNLTDTLDTFRNEYDRPREDISMLSWYEMTMKMRLPEMIRESPSSFTVMENVINNTIQNVSHITRRKPQVVVEGLATLPIASKLPNVVPPLQMLQQDSSIQLGSVETSLGDPNDFLSEQKSLDSRGNASLHTKKSANSAVSLLSKIKKQKEEDKLEKQLEEKQKISRAGQRITMSEEAQMIVKAELERQQDEILMKSGGSKKKTFSDENWIPDLERSRSWERSFKVAKENLYDIQLRQMQEEREMKQFKVTALERAKNALSLRKIREKQCGCCLLMFLPLNLPLKVSQKAVLDIRVKWGGKLTSKTVFGGTNPEIGEYLATPESEAEKTRLRIMEAIQNGDTISEAGNSVSITSSENKKKSYLEKMSERLSMMPRCYSEVPICNFCAQFFQAQEEYRPQYSQIVYNEKKADHDLREKKEKEYWDPLKTVEKERAEAIAEEEKANMTSNMNGTAGGSNMEEGSVTSIEFSVVSSQPSLKSKQ